MTPITRNYDKISINNHSFIHPWDKDGWWPSSSVSLRRTDFRNASKACHQTHETNGATMADSYGRSALKHLVPVKEQRCRILPSPAQELLNKLILSDWGTRTGRNSGIAVDGVVWLQVRSFPFDFQLWKIKLAWSHPLSRWRPLGLMTWSKQHFNTFEAASGTLRPVEAGVWAGIKMGPAWAAWHSGKTSIFCFIFLAHIQNVCAHWIIHPVHPASLALLPLLLKDPTSKLRILPLHLSSTYCFYSWDPKPTC